MEPIGNGLGEGDLGDLGEPPVLAKACASTVSDFVFGLMEFWASALSLEG